MEFIKEQRINEFTFLVMYKQEIDGITKFFTAFMKGEFLYLTICSLSLSAASREFNKRLRELQLL